MSCEQPIIIRRPIIDKDGKSVILQFDNEYKLVLVPHLDRAGHVQGLEEFTLIYHNETHAHYVSQGFIEELQISKLYLAELLEIAYFDYLRWESLHNPVPEVLYAERVAETTAEIAIDLRLAAA